MAKDIYCLCNFLELFHSLEIAIFWMTMTPEMTIETLNEFIRIRLECTSPQPVRDLFLLEPLHS